MLKFKYVQGSKLLNKKKFPNNVLKSCSVCVWTAATPGWVVRVMVVRLCLWVARVVCTTTLSSMSCSTPSASIMNRPALTGTTTSGCTGKILLMVLDLHCLSVVKVAFDAEIISENDLNVDFLICFYWNHLQMVFYNNNELSFLFKYKND